MSVNRGFTSQEAETPHNGAIRAARERAPLAVGGKQYGGIEMAPSENPEKPRRF